MVNPDAHYVRRASRGWRCPDRSARTTGIRCRSVRRQASSICRASSWDFRMCPMRSSRRVSSGSTSASTCAASRDAGRSEDQRRSAHGRARPSDGLGSRAAERSLGRRACCRLEWRRAVDCRQSRVPGQGERGILAYNAATERSSGRSRRRRHRRGTGDLLDRRRAVHRRCSRAGAECCRC